jgi:hypothetical protein
MLEITMKDGEVKRIMTNTMKLDQLGVTYPDEEMEMPIIITFDRMKSFKADITITPGMITRSLEYQKKYSSDGPMAKTKHSEA